MKQIEENSSKLSLHSSLPTDSQSISKSPFNASKKPLKLLKSKITESSPQISPILRNCHTKKELHNNLSATANSQSTRQISPKPKSQIHAGKTRWKNLRWMKSQNSTINELNENRAANYVLIELNLAEHNSQTIKIFVIILSILIFVNIFSSNLLKLKVYNLNVCKNLLKL